ncbi:nuclear transport factor 2 family protein [Arenibacter certesii]|nr:nuclear transport factor 2 family protein [Arenibacter certesii]
MKENHRIKQAIIDFVKGGDTSDVELLDKVLHKDFRVTNNGFMGTSGITIVTKNEYLNKIKSGVFGGLPRQLEILEIDQSGKIASVKLRIESAENDFISYNSFVLDADKEWKLINNLAVVKSKKNELK